MFTKFQTANLLEQSDEILGMAPWLFWLLVAIVVIFLLLLVVGIIGKKIEKDREYKASLRRVYERDGTADMVDWNKR